jgi:hypothetical protein
MPQLWSSRTTTQARSLLRYGVSAAPLPQLDTERKAMGISLLLLAVGLLLAMTGTLLLVIGKQRGIAMACLIAGIVLILVPPIFVIVVQM